MEDGGVGDQEQCGQNYVIHRDLLNLGLRWSVAEVEIAAQDRTVWKILTSQAASADMHDADW